MSIWGEIKTALNSTLGTANQKPLDQIVEYTNALIGGASDTGGNGTEGSVMGKLNALITNTGASTSASSSGTLSQKLTYIISTLIGATGATGGSATAGTVMAKLNKIISNDQYLAKNYVFLAGDTEMYSSSGSFTTSSTSSNGGSVLGYFTPVYRGTLRIKFTVASTASGLTSASLIKVSDSSTVELFSVQKSSTATSHSKDVDVEPGELYKIVVYSGSTNYVSRKITKWALCGSKVVPSDFNPTSNMS